MVPLLSSVLPEQERHSWIYEIEYSLPLVHWLLVSLLKLTSFHRFFILFIVHFWNMSISSGLILFPPTSGVLLLLFLWVIIKSFI